MAATPLVPLELYPTGVFTPSTPFNNDMLALQVFMLPVISKVLTTPPGSPAEYALYIIGGTPTGGWAAFAANDLVIYYSGIWHGFTPFGGQVKLVDGVLEVFDAGWAELAVASTPSPPDVQSVVSAATITPTFSNDLVKVTALAVAATLANPSGTAVDGWGMVVRIKDDGTARALSYGSQYRAADSVTLPTTTVIGKTHYLSMVWNAEDTKMDVLAVGFMP